MAPLTPQETAVGVVVGYTALQVVVAALALLAACAAAFWPIKETRE